MINSTTTVELTHMQSYKILTLMQEEIDSLINLISSKETKFTVKNHFKKVI